VCRHACRRPRAATETNRGGVRGETHECVQNSQQEAITSWAPPHTPRPTKGHGSRRCLVAEWLTGFVARSQQAAPAAQDNGICLSLSLCVYGERCREAQHTLIARRKLPTRSMDGDGMHHMARQGDALMQTIVRYTGWCTCTHFKNSRLDPAAQ
jgi:hypothetical protein